MCVHCRLIAWMWWIYFVVVMLLLCCSLIFCCCVCVCLCVCLLCLCYWCVWLLLALSGLRIFWGELEYFGGNLVLCLGNFGLVFKIPKNMEYFSTWRNSEHFSAFHNSDQLGDGWFSGDITIQKIFVRWFSCLWIPKTTEITFCPFSTFNILWPRGTLNVFFLLLALTFPHSLSLFLYRYRSFSRDLTFFSLSLSVFLSLSLLLLSFVLPCVCVSLPYNACTICHYFLSDKTWRNTMSPDFDLQKRLRLFS